MVYEYTHYDKYVIEQLTGNVELPLLEFEHNKGYLVSHNLKLISNSSNDLIKLIKTEFRYCFNKDKCTKLLLLILAKDTVSIDYDIEEYMHISQYELLNKDIPRRVKEESSISEIVEEKIDTRIKVGEHRYITPNYRTEEDIYIVANNYGCYAIYNETLKTIYVGETTVSFHKRWNNHYTKKDMSKKKREFLNHPDTYCMILYISNGDKQETEEIEAQCIEYYKQEYPTWTILGGTYQDNKNKYY